MESLSLGADFLGANLKTEVLFPAQAAKFTSKKEEALTPAAVEGASSTNHLQNSCFAGLELQRISTSLGRSVLDCHKVFASQREVLVVHNFIPGRDEHGWPTALLPDPSGDIYLNFLAASCVSFGEKALCLPLQPGLKEYYQQMGVINDVSQILETPFALDAKGRLGYPFSDPLAWAEASGMKLEGRPVLIAGFPGYSVNCQAMEIGALPVQESEAALSSNKADFRQAAKRFGYEICPGMLLQTEADIASAIEKFGSSFQVWLKLDRGSGGDMVLPVEGPLTMEKIAQALASLKKSVYQAFAHTDFKPEEVEEYWPKDSLLPQMAQVVLEQDVRCLGKMLVNGSNAMLIKEDGSFEVLQYFKQRTGPNGDYRGSQPDNDLSPAMKEKLDEQMRRIAYYCQRELRLYGIVGVDYMLVENAAGEQFPVMIELNGRPPISSTAMMIANKLSAKHWLNVNMWSNAEINTIEDFERAVTVNGFNYARGNLKDGLVIPQAMRALYGQSENGAKELLISSNAAKILVCAESGEKIEEICRNLEQNGNRFVSA